MKTKFLPALGLMAMLLLAGCQTKMADWPQWRGPDRDGKVAGFKAPEKWPAQLTEKWRVPLGPGDATPALVGDKLYILARDLQDTNNEIILCLDAGSGKTVWENKYAAEHVVTGPPARHPGPRSSPVVTDGKVITFGVGGILSCLDATSGQVIWRKKSTNDFLGTPYQFDTGMSPLVADGKCIVHVGGKTNGAVIAFDLGTGEPKWKWVGEAPSFSSPVVMTVQGAKQLVKLTAKRLVGISLEDGKLLWELPFEATQGNNTTPIVDGQTVIYTGQGKGMFAIKIDGSAEGYAATPVWTNTAVGARFTTPVLKDGMLFGYNGHLFCADARTGATLWSDSTSRGMSAAVLDAGSEMIALGVNSELVVFEPSGKEYKELAKLKVANTETWAHPVLATLSFASSLYSLP